MASEPSEAANPRELFERYVADPTEANAAMVRRSLRDTIDAERAKAEAVVEAARDLLDGSLTEGVAKHRLAAAIREYQNGGSDG